MSNASYSAIPHQKIFGFERQRQSGIHVSLQTSLLYDTISEGSDYRVVRWGDSKYRAHLQPLVSEQEWMQFKRDILQIYTEQNAKRAALRKLIQFNPYRSISELQSDSVYCIIDCLFCGGFKPDLLRDPQNICIRCMKFILFFPLFISHYSVFLLFVCVFVLCVAVDVLTFPRLFIYRDRHQAFLEAVMAEHPDLDPVLVEEELIQKLRRLTDSMTADHPGVYCRFTSVLGCHHSKEGSSYYESFQIQFLQLIQVVSDFQQLQL